MASIDRMHSPDHDHTILDVMPASPRPAHNSLYAQDRHPEHPECCPGAGGAPQWSLEGTWHPALGIVFLSQQFTY